MWSLRLLTHWAWFCTAAYIWGPWWLGGCRWSHSPQRPRRSRNTLSSSLSPLLHEWFLQGQPSFSRSSSSTNPLMWCDKFLPDCMSKAACSFGGQYIALAVVLADVRAARALGRLLRAWYVLLSSNWTSTSKALSSIFLSSCSSWEPGQQRTFECQGPSIRKLQLWNKMESTFFGHR